MDVESTESGVLEVTVSFLTGLITACLIPFAAEHSGKNKILNFQLRIFEIYFLKPYALLWTKVVLFLVLMVDSPNGRRLSLL